MSIQRPDFILYSRSYCHLCEDMLLALEKFRACFEFAVEVIDVDGDDKLVAQYDELVPVLVGVRMADSGETKEQLCHYFLDEQKVVKFLESRHTHQASFNDSRAPRG